ncbi:MAG: hypothetical protein FWG63_11600 [Defluviitaleaceae bacterium]|nr:hypothetical protein [Defluviitaleaceae bacterium]
MAMVTSIIALLPLALTKKKRQDIHENGLVHFTNPKNIESILDNRYLLGSERDIVYFFTNHSIPSNIFIHNVHRKQELKTYAKITITNINERQTRFMYARYYENVIERKLRKREDRKIYIMHGGDFHFLKENIVQVEELSAKELTDTPISRPFKLSLPIVITRTIAFFVSMAVCITILIM